MSPAETSRRTPATQPERTHTVTATYSGQQVYLGCETLWPSTRTLLTLHLETVSVSERSAHILARLAEKDETLSNITITDLSKSSAEEFSPRN